MKREHSIGASVSETSADTAIDAVTVSANSRNSRPMIPPISSSGMNTAISEKLIDSTVKPISREPLSAASIGGIAVLDVPVDVLDDDDRVVDHEADRDRERHQRQVVEAEIEQIHRRERAEQRQRHGDARNQRRPEIAQEQQDHQHDQDDGQRQRELDVRNRGADRRGAVEDGVDLDRGRNVGGRAAAAAP